MIRNGDQAASLTHSVSGGSSRVIFDRGIVLGFHPP